MINLVKLLAALLVAVALALVGYAWFLSRKPAPLAIGPANGAAAPAALYPVVVMVKPVPSGLPIAAGDVKVAHLSVNPNGAFRDAAAVIGKVPVFDLGVDSPVLSQQLASGLAARIDAGERAVAVKVDESSAVGHRIKPGDFVDVFVTLKRDNGHVMQSQTRLLLSRKRVLAYGASSIDGAAPAQAQAAAQSRAEPGRTAVLAIGIEEVNALSLAEANGRLALVLRNPADSAVATAERFTAPQPLFSPVASKNGRGATPAPLQGMDLARAGLSLEGLAGQGKAATAQAPRWAVARHTVSTAAAATGTGGDSVEVIRGTRVETIRP